MTNTHLYFQCKFHKKELRWTKEYINERMMSDDPNDDYTPLTECPSSGFDVRWDRFCCVMGGRKCESKWRVIILEKQSPAITR